MSAGAIEAGAEVVLGCDCSATPLKIWSSNVGTSGKAVLARLGRDEIVLQDSRQQRPAMAHIVDVSSKDWK